jgi:hypothetical protein
VVGFTTGSRGEAPGKKENLWQEMMMMIIIIIIIIIQAETYAKNTAISRWKQNTGKLFANLTQYQSMPKYHTDCNGNESGIPRRELGD